MNNIEALKEANLKLYILELKEQAKIQEIIDQTPDETVKQRLFQLFAARHPKLQLSGA